MPMAPTDTHRVGNVYMGVFTTEVMVHVVAAQSEADRARGRDTVVLVESALEAELLQADLEKEGLLVEEIGTPVPESDVSRGRLSIMVPEKVVNHFVHAFCCAVGSDLPLGYNDRTTVMVNLGWGNVSFKMASCLIVLVRMIDKPPRADQCEMIVCALRDGDTSVHTHPSDQVLVIDDADRVLARPTIEWHSLKDHKQDLKRIFEGASGRSIILSNVFLLGEALDRPHEKVCDAFANFGPLADPAVALRRGEGVAGQEHILVHEDMAYLGPMAGIQNVLVHPYTSAWVHDEYSTHAVWQRKVLRSQAEIRHAVYLRSAQDTVPRSHCFLTQAEFGSLEKSRRGSCHNVELDKFLITCICFQCPQLLSRLIGLPDPRILEDQLHRLRYRGLLQVGTLDREEPPDFVDRWNLTEIGKQVQRLFMFHGVESTPAAHLFAQLRIGPECSPAVCDAMVSLATILSTTSHMPVMNRVVLKASAHFAQKPILPDLLDGDLDGIGLPLRCRGAIWFCVAIWHGMRKNPAWRAKTRRVYTMGDDTAESEMLLLCDKHIALNRLVSFEWDEALKEGLSFLELGDDAVGADEHRLDQQELLFVEKALVRALVDKVVFINIPRTCGLRHLPFAYDMASRRDLREPTAWTFGTMDVDKCLDMEALVSPPLTYGLFGVYTHLVRTEDGLSDFIWEPVNLTYVSTRAVKEVFEEIEASHPSQSLINRTWTRINVQRGRR